MVRLGPAPVHPEGWNNGNDEWSREPSPDVIGATGASAWVWVLGYIGFGWDGLGWYRCTPGLVLIEPQFVSCGILLYADCGMLHLYTRAGFMFLLTAAAVAVFFHHIMAFFRWSSIGSLINSVAHPCTAV